MAGVVYFPTKFPGERRDGRFIPYVNNEPRTAGMTTLRNSPSFSEGLTTPSTLLNRPTDSAVGTVACSGRTTTPQAIGRHPGMTQPTRRLKRPATTVTGNRRIFTHGKYTFPLPSRGCAHARRPVVVPSLATPTEICMAVRRARRLNPASAVRHWAQDFLAPSARARSSSLAT